MVNGEGLTPRKAEGLIGGQYSHNVVHENILGIVDVRGGGCTIGGRGSGNIPKP